MVTVFHQALVVQKLDSAILRINHYPVDSIEETNCVIHWIEINPVDVHLCSFIHLLNN